MVMSGPAEKVLEGQRFRSDENVKGTVVPAAAQGVLCRGDPSSGASMGYLPQHLCGQVLIVSLLCPEQQFHHHLSPGMAENVTIVSSPVKCSSFKQKHPILWI
jgi:hypothetical protein